jgi:hypothetical protein
MAGLHGVDREERGGFNFGALSLIRHLSLAPWRVRHPLPHSHTLYALLETGTTRSGLWHAHLPSSVR